jgi:hypothetical protein
MTARVIYARVVRARAKAPDESLGIRFRELEEGRDSCAHLTVHSPERTLECVGPSVTRADARAAEMARNRPRRARSSRRQYTRYVAHATTHVRKHIAAGLVASVEGRGRGAGGKERRKDGKVAN